MCLMGKLISVLFTWISVLLLRRRSRVNLIKVHHWTISTTFLICPTDLKSCTGDFTFLLKHFPEFRRNGIKASKVLENDVKHTRIHTHTSLHLGKPS